MTQNRSSRNEIEERPHIPLRRQYQFPPGGGGDQRPPGMADHPPSGREPSPLQNNADRLLTPTEPRGTNVRTTARIDIISIALFILVIVFSITFILEKRWKIAVQETSRAEADKANAELSFLKAQINPHFLFNTLNNIYSLAVAKSEHAADAIMKLSNIMRYVTDDVNEDFVSLDKELAAVGDYMSLQRLRLGKNAIIDYTVAGNANGKIIAPLIIIPFIENAFTHGISNATESKIIIKIYITEETIVLDTENRVFAKPRNTDRTGIGISNTKKRLGQIYPGRHLLDINSGNGLFTVHLVMYI